MPMPYTNNQSLTCGAKISNFRHATDINLFLLSQYLLLQKKMLAKTLTAGAVKKSLPDFLVKVYLF